MDQAIDNYVTSNKLSCHSIFMSPAISEEMYQVVAPQSGKNGIYKRKIYKNSFPYHITIFITLNLQNEEDKQQL